jgi:hypothetical protein
VEFFVEKYTRKLGKSIEKIPKQSLDALAEYSWPGNAPQHPPQPNAQAGDSTTFLIPDKKRQINAHLTH